MVVKESLRFKLHRMMPLRELGCLCKRRFLKNKRNRGEMSISGQEMVSYVRILGQGILCEERVETLGGGGGGEGIGEGEGEGHSNVSEVDEDFVKVGTIVGQ